MSLLSYFPVLPAALLPLLLSIPWSWTGVVKYGSECIVHKPGPANASDPARTADWHRTTVNFESQGEQLEGWLYLPTSHDREPRIRPDLGVHRCLVMAHGLGGQRDFGLERFAEVFATEGFAVLVFDYRCFGGSSGEPRNWVSPRRHIEDWISSVHALQPGGNVSTSQGVTCSSLALWGTSFSGGHVLVAAAELAPAVQVNALISQVPHLSGFEASKASLLQRGPFRALLLLLAGLHDVVRSKLGLPAAYIRIVGKPGDLAFMLLNDEEERGYYSKHPAVKLGGWTPWAPARLALEISRYSPVNYLHKVNAPVLFISATKDSLCSPTFIRKAADKCSRCELLEYDVDHFSIYSGDTFKRSTHEMVRFLNSHLN